MTPFPTGTRGSVASFGTRLRAITVVLLCLAVPSAGLAFPSDNVHIFADEGEVALADRAAAIIRTASQTLAAELGMPPPEEITLVVVRGHAAFERECGNSMPEWSIAAALPDRDALVVDAAQVSPATPADLRVTLMHEMVHLFLFRIERERAGRLPLWFHEGLAQYLSGQPLFPAGREAFLLAASTGRLIPFDSLDREFPTAPDEARLAYLQSEAFVSHVAQRTGKAAFARLLQFYRQGGSFDDAFAAAFGSTRAEMESKWSRGLRRALPSWRFLAHPSAVLVLMALLTIAAFAVVAHRAKRQEKLWEREEADTTDSPPEDEERGE